MAATALVTAGTACQVDDTSTKYRLAKLLEKAESLEKRIDQIQKTGLALGGQPGAQPPVQPMPRPGAPDPTVAYSVPIDGNPISGPPNAKITLVEAADFA
jgi:hypothetical protein